MTAMSSRRSFGIAAPTGATSSNAAALSITAFVIGLALLAVGIYMNIALLAVIGFVPFTATLLYWNAMFWSKVGGDRLNKFSFRNYPY